MSWLVYIISQTEAICCLYNIKTKNSLIKKLSNNFETCLSSHILSMLINSRLNLQVDNILSLIKMTTYKHFMNIKLGLIEFISFNLFLIILFKIFIYLLTFLKYFFPTDI